MWIGYDQLTESESETAHTVSRMILQNDKLT